jgi:hypothetical protein
MKYTSRMKIQNPQEHREEILSLLDGKKAKELVDLECCGCSAPMKKDKSRILAALKNNTDMYCSAKCYSSSNTTKVKLSCEVCGKEVERQPSQVSPHVYCSRKCSRAANNNRLGTGTALRHPVTGKYSVVRCSCGNTMDKSSEMCQACRKKLITESTLVRLSKKTFGEYKAECSGESHRYYNSLRSDSRYLVSSSGRKKVCVECGYDFYVELCHIRPISDFPDSATLEEINLPENAVYLCPNHHKELDRGKLQPKPSWFSPK